MCIETMETKAIRLTTSFKRKATMRPVLHPKRRLQQASRTQRSDAVSVRKFTRREEKAIRIAKLMKAALAKPKPGNDENDAGRYAILGVDSLNVDYTHHPCAMAPHNTTQYLMERVYEDLSSVTIDHLASQQGSCGYGLYLYDDSLSPGALYDVLDRTDESSLDFQARDFEEILALRSP